MKNKFMKIFYLLFIAVLNFLISFNSTFAQEFTQNIKKFSDNITNNILASGATLLMTAAFLVFFYGVMMFIVGRVSEKGDLKDLEKGKQFMLWGLIALFVMVSAWGIIRMAQGLLDVPAGDIKIKPVQFSGITNTSGGGGDSPLSTERAGGSGGDFRDPPVPERSSTANPYKSTQSYPVISKVGDSDAKYGTVRPINKIGNLLLAKKCLPSNYNTANNVYDQTLKDAVINLQKSNGVSADGAVGPSTWEILYTGVGNKTSYLQSNITVKACPSTLNFDKGW